MEEKERDFQDETYKRENKIAQKEFQAIYRAKEVSEHLHGNNKRIYNERRFK